MDEFVPDRIDNDAVRVKFAEAARDVMHGFVGSEASTESLEPMVASLRALADTIDKLPDRDRLALMREAHARAESAGMSFMREGSGVDDRAVAGRANPMGVDFEYDRMGTFSGEPGAPTSAYDDIVVGLTLRRAFQGAPGRAHGGIVAAAFDDVTGWVIGRLGEPAYTGEITVRFNAPVPVGERLVIRTRLSDRERRKLFITAEMFTDDGTKIATCKATYITVDPATFGGIPQ